MTRRVKLENIKKFTHAPGGPAMPACCPLATASAVKFKACLDREGERRGGRGECLLHAAKDAAAD